VKFPIGGIAREPKGRIRCNSGADSDSLDGRRKIIWRGVFCDAILIVHLNSEEPSGVFFISIIRFRVEFP